MTNISPVDLVITTLFSVAGRSTSNHDVNACSCFRSFVSFFIFFLTSCGISLADSVERVRFLHTDYSFVEKRSSPFTFEVTRSLLEKWSSARTRWADHLLSLLPNASLTAHSRVLSENKVQYECSPSNTQKQCPHLLLTSGRLGLQ